MKRITKILIALVVVMTFMVGCGKNDQNHTNIKDNKETTAKKKVTVTTSFIKDMVKQLVSDKVDIQLIIPAGEDPHIYKAKPDDLDKIKNADLLLYHGLHFEGTMQEVLSKTGVEITKNFPKDKIGSFEEDGELVVDPHFWFDIGLYKEATKVVAEELENLLPDYKNEINEKEEEYLKKLDDLDKDNRKMLEEIPEKSRKLITPHDAFNYFSRAYNIEVKAPQGVSTESEISNTDISETVNFIIDNKVKAIFAESTTDPARMEKIKEAVKQKGFEVKVVSGEDKELFSDSLAPEGQSGDNYIDMYKHNIKLIVDNLK